ncbi:MAG: hypothetical protein K5765_03065 [Clostridia bacterium]|nr:hypothetical protein [Clostridia bacterium]
MSNAIYNYPKLLIISHNMFDKNNNIGKTLISLLSSWPSDKLCQIYLRDDKPTFDYCDNYYRILDKEIVKSYFKGKKIVGSIFDKDNSSFHNNSFDRKEQTLYNIGNKRIPLISMIRDMLWSKKSWRNSKFDEWLEKQKPEVILFVPNDYKLIYPIASYVMKKMNIPLVPYFMDDAFYFGTYVSLIDYFRRKSIRKSASILLSECDEIITIGPKMSDFYNHYLKKECENLMNSVKVRYPNEREYCKKYIISYVGNLHSNRWKSIVKIGKRLERMNNGYSIHIYSASFVSKKMKKEFEKIKCLSFNGKVDASKVNNVLDNSDALLFVESFDRKSKASTKFSLSTKIPEYLNCYKKIFAFGPSDISSIEYLKNNQLAVVCSSKEEIDKCLNELFESMDNINLDYIYDFLKKNHDIESNQVKLKNIIFKKVE